jgi:hypothetical protein
MDELEGSFSDPDMRGGETVSYRLSTFQNARKSWLPVSVNVSLDGNRVIADDQMKGRLLGWALI